MSNFFIGLGLAITTVLLQGVLVGGSLIEILPPSWRIFVKGIMIIVVVISIWLLASVSYVVSSYFKIFIYVLLMVGVLLAYSLFGADEFRFSVSFLAILTLPILSVFVFVYGNRSDGSSICFWCLFSSLLLGFVLYFLRGFFCSNAVCVSLRQLTVMFFCFVFPVFIISGIGVRFLNASTTYFDYIKSLSLFVVCVLYVSLAFHL